MHTLMKRVRHTSFRLKMFMLFFCFTVAISLGIGIIVYSISAQMLRGQMQDTMHNNLANLSRSFDTDTQTVMDITATLSLDTEVLDSVQTTAPTSSYEYYSIAYSMRKKLTAAVVNNPSLKSIYVADSEGDTFYKNNIARTYYADELEKEGPLGGLRKMPENRWEIVAATPLVESEPEPTLSFMNVVRSANMRHSQGYVMANIGLSQIQETFGEISFGRSGFVVVFTPDMQPLYHPTDPPGRGTVGDITSLIDVEVTQNTLYVDDAMLTYMVSPTSGFVYAAYIPLAEVVAPAVQVRNVTAFLLAVGLVLALLYMLFVSKWLFSPIHTLVYYMGRAGKGETNIQISEQRHDEMGVLFGSFNRMISQIDQLMHKLYLQEILSKELQLENLQILFSVK